MEIEKTQRGFEIIKFLDQYEQECSLQQSSAIDNTERGFTKLGSSYVWFGTIERMHLSRDHVKELISHLQKWVDTGSFK